jgi:hypothetical protein
MQQAHSLFLNSLCTIAGGIFNMPNKFFISKYDCTSRPQVMDLIRWEAGKGKMYDIFKVPILYPDHVVNEKKVFKNWLVIAKVKPTHQRQTWLLICCLKGYQGCDLWKNVIVFQSTWQTTFLCQDMEAYKLYSWPDCIWCHIGRSY